MKNILFKNISWQLFERFIGIGLKFIVSIYVIRYLGPVGIGVLSYSASYVLLFSALTTCGLQSIVVKEMVAKRYDVGSIMGSAWVIMLLGAAIALILSLSGAVLLGDATDVLIIIIFANIANLVASLSIISFYFQAEMKTRYVSYAMLGQDIFDTITQLGFVYFKLSVLSFGSLVLVENILLYFTLYIIYSKNAYLLKWSYSWHLIKYLLRQSFPLAIAGAVINLYMRLDQVMIEHYCGLGAVGEYSVGIKLAEMVYLLPGIISANILPIMVAKFEKSKLIFDAYMIRIYRYLFYSALFIAGVFYFSAQELVYLVYGDKYKIAAEVFQIGGFSIIAVFIGYINHLWLQVNGLQRYAVYITCCGLLSCFFVNLLLIPRFGVMGAVFAMVLTQSIASIFAFALFSETRESFLLFLHGILFNKRCHSGAGRNPE
jgi:O-antigen/teichoic acid export membrane protein